MKKITVFYDDWCPNCMRFKKHIERGDVFHLICYETLRTNNIQQVYPGMNYKRATQIMATQVGDKWYYGFDSMFLIFLRSPIYWGLLPLLWILKITGLGNVIYRNLAVRRRIIPLHCDDQSCLRPK